MSEPVRKITLQDPDYPELLKALNDPPPALYLKGTLLPEDRFAVAVVGTRNATPYGLLTARRLGKELAQAGITVISGLAEGIDSAAHEGALEAQGRTIAVLGHGFKYLYPPQNRELAERIVASGALVSQFPMETEPAPYRFPERNVVIAGLSLGVVVVEAPLKSGALITAREALDAGREVFAVPGPVSSGKSEGCHRLLKDGAKLTEDVRDILEELASPLRALLQKGSDPLRPPRSQTPPGFLSPVEAAVYEAIPIGAGVSADRLAEATSTATGQLLPALTALEIRGLIRQLPGQGYWRLR